MEGYDVIIIRGAPGVGKSTLATALAKYFQNGVTIEVGPVLRMINTFEDGISKQYSDVLDNIRLLVVGFIEKGYSPITVVGPLKAARANDHFLSSLSGHFKCLTITLLASENELSSRIDKRVGGFKNKEVAYIVNKDMVENTLENEIRLSTSDKTPEDVLSEMVTLLNL